LLASQGCWAPNSLNNPKPPLQLGRFATVLRVSLSNGGCGTRLRLKQSSPFFHLKVAMLGCAEGEIGSRHELATERFLSLWAAKKMNSPSRAKRLSAKVPRQPSLVSV